MRSGLGALAATGATLILHLTKPLGIAGAVRTGISVLTVMVALNAWLELGPPLRRRNVAWFPAISVSAPAAGTSMTARRCC